MKYLNGPLMKICSLMSSLMKGTDRRLTTAQQGYKHKSLVHAPLTNMNKLTKSTESVREKWQTVL